jgi:hypothetical protein
MIQEIIALNKEIFKQKHIHHTQNNRIEDLDKKLDVTKIVVRA